MSIDAKTVAELRRRTGLPMMKCKEALSGAGGDLTLAEENLRKEGHKTIDKLKDREMKEGLVFTAEDKGAVAAVAVLCETDFVARSTDVQQFGELLVRGVLAAAPSDKGSGEALHGLRLEDGRTVKDHLEDLVGKRIRENMKIGSFARFKPQAGGYVGLYVHHNRKIACLVDLEGKDVASKPPVKELAKDLGMQIAFHAQLLALDPKELDPEWVAKEREIFVAQVQDMPEGKRAQIAEGKLSKRMKEVVLLEQPFLKDEKTSVKQRVEAVGKEAGTSVRIRRFARVGAGA
ncbi:MAG TPA: translation elongation factor Ts [Planctomycetota bacterium]|nr:translation elongation factor Ts [Planctomycetota bacterium]